MSIKVKSGGAYADITGVFHKRAGAYEAVQGVFVKAGGVYGRVDAAPTLDWATWDAANKSAQIALSPDALTSSASAAGSWLSVKATVARTTGKYYFEIVATNTGGGDGPLIGMCLTTSPLSAYNPTDSCTVRTDLGYLVSNGVFAHQNLGVGGAHGALFRFALDLDAGKAWISGAASDTWFNSGDPEAGTNPQVLFTPGTAVLVLSGHYETDSAVVANFGQSAFARPVPAGFTPGWGV